MISPIAKKLLLWYRSRERNLPWRKNPKPYAVWVAEIMAQQTRLETMLPYYHRWMRRFPSVKSLAKAQEQDVLELWEGLGYYSRARNLCRAALIVKEEYGGRLPRTIDELQKLPGVGTYTAGAIASLAFGADEPAVDGNAVRVLSRLFNVKDPPTSGKGNRRFWELAKKHLPIGQAADYNQALMDLGATVCTAKNPKCDVCPVAQYCKGRKLGVQEKLPVKLKPAEMPLREFAAAVIRTDRRILIVRRPTSGLLGGMWEFPNIEIASTKQAKAKLRQVLRKEFGFTPTLTAKLATFQHTYSHFYALLLTYDCPVNGDVPKLKHVADQRWVKPDELKKFPMGRLDRRIADLLQNPRS
jgi:A/G-specific adenine glycosylase